MCRRALLALAALVVAAPLVSGPTSLARFTAADTATASLATGSLAAPTSLAGTGGPTTATLTWVPSVSAAATGYQVLRSATAGSGHAQVGSVTPVSAATTTDTPGDGTWYYILRTFLEGWTSPASNEAAVYIGTAVATGLKTCTMNAAVTSGAGDNNGYESNAARGCALDGLAAQDVNSGTNTLNSCTNAGKDRHRFWGYAFGLPGSVSSITGITVQADMGINNNSGAILLCVELSWDGGTSWTAPQSVPITKVPLNTYTLGGAADTWGRGPWTLAELSAPAFQVRLTDVSTDSTKTFRLDNIGVQVHYLP